MSIELSVIIHHETAAAWLVSDTGERADGEARA
jgi:hypothetical protein